MYIVKYVLWVSVIVILPGLAGIRAQSPGCTDPQALNYSPAAGVNDGSCLYPPVSLMPASLVRSLPATVKETSGLIFLDGFLWTHNDSGGEPVLYKLDTLRGKVRATLTITNARNVDWEEITRDQDYIYIGDFGNNLGNRKDLLIYKVSKAAITGAENGEAEAEIIRFAYGDQLDFNIANRSNNFDCEAMLASGDSLYLFSKNWADQHTRLYALPKTPGEYIARPKSSFNADGLITGADISPSGKEVMLCGYKNYSPFIWLLYDFRDADFFGGNKRRIDFSGHTGTQTEGVAYLRDYEAVISSERTAVSPAGLFKIFTRPWTGNTGDSLPDAFK